MSLLNDALLAADRLEKCQDAIRRARGRQLDELASAEAEAQAKYDKALGAWNKMAEDMGWGA